MNQIREVFADYASLPKVSKQDLWAFYKKLHDANEHEPNVFNGHQHMIYLMVLELIVRKELGI